MITLRERLCQVPVPHGPRSLAHLPRVAMDGDLYRSIGFLRSVQMAVRRHGPVLNLGFDKDGDKILLGEADFCDAWRRHSRQLIKEVDGYPAPASLARLLLDDNLTTAREGREWEQMRSRVVPLMRYKLTSYAEAVDQATADMIDQLLRSDPDRPSLWTICSRWAAMTVAQPVLGFGFTHDLVLDIVNMLRGCMFHLVQEAARQDQAGLRADPTLLRTRARLAQAVQDAIAMCRPGDDTMVGTLLDARGHPRGAPATTDMVAELQPILIGALAATVHNNSLALFWTMTKLAQHPSVAADLAVEACGMRDRQWHLSAAPHALAALREALRINPVLPFIERKATADLVLNGIAIPRGTTVVFAPWVVQRDPRNWPDPLAYRPDRFVPGARVDLTRWFPFGLGHRACIGSNLALNQIARGISLTCQALELSIQRHSLASHWQPTWRVLLEPREDGGMLIARPRKIPFSANTGAMP